MLSGCGFLGEEPFSGKRVADVAPWQDVGPLFVCDQTLSLVAPSASPAGFCGAASTKICKADADCGSRERCLCGLCTVGYCDATEDCQPGFVCTTATHRCDRPCQADGDCAKNETCVEGRNLCRGQCNGDSDCQIGEFCNLPTGECLATSCFGEGDCTSSCAIQRKPSLLAEPTPLAEKSGLTLWLERDGQIVRASSSDGMHFTLDPAALPLDGRAPSVVAVSGGYLMLLERAGAIHRSMSSDGRVWSDPQQVIANAGQPALVQNLDRSFAAYVVSDGKVLRADSTDGLSFDAPDLVLAPSSLEQPTLWRNVDQIASPFAQALLDSGGRPFVRLWFSARGQESAPAFNFNEYDEVPANFSIGEATSPDGASFDPYPFNPVFDRVVMFIQHPDELEPALVALGDTQLLYYRRGDLGPLAVAKSPPTPR
jgi:hypothetical protein